MRIVRTGDKRGAGDGVRGRVDRRLGFFCGLRHESNHAPAGESAQPETCKGAIDERPLMLTFAGEKGLLAAAMRFRRKYALASPDEGLRGGVFRP